MVTDDFVGELRIRPIWWRHPPKVKITLDDCTRWNAPLETECVLNWCDCLPRGRHVLQVEFSGKTNQDTTPQHDHAVVIESIAFFGITNDKFKWQGVYTPEYPEPWCSEQLVKGITLPNHLKAQDYLGWNGTWCLTFTTPIFTWMHEVLDLGWTYG